ncbi:Thioredoxin-like protein CXXS1 [Platanthera zijinensis]|uniref:Thioredoxin-like protein CXXS1 n=1 Tax=Platanthera zijinensis TaxID=2320716 RepID=A0AAP0BL01_9ASPA
MEAQNEVSRSRVVKVQSVESWESFMAQAKSHGSPVFVHFGASWCVPSLAMNSYVEELAMNYPDILFFLVDVDEVQVLKLNFFSFLLIILLSGLPFEKYL